MNGDKREFYAESVQKAVEKAASSLGIDPEQLSYVVVDGGSSGFLGIGARDARITVDAAGQPDDSPTGQNIVSSPPVEAVSQSQTDIESIGSVPLPEQSARADVESSTPPPSSEEAPEDLIVAVDGFATELLEKMGFDATVDAYDAGDAVKVDIGTEEAGLLIGQKGETIDAFQYLLNVVVYKHRPFIKRITVDTEGYRQRRIEALQGMAHRLARRAQREKRPLNLPPMAAAERRVVHLYLKENPNVSTSSEGGEEDRRVVITPTN
ncbi:MAG: hypothetical protein CYG60_10650 [Actinobacteria bacterium]|jgi:spoIIIJ-associated protein|nr:MAG: hypothetical protein CYG60_10650 [Actinomycetota bacterium]